MGALETQAAAIEVALQARGALQRIGKRHVPVGAHQVARAAGQAGARSRLAPLELVQRESARGAGLGEGPSRLAMNVHLPIQRLQRREVVALRSLYPREPISAVHAPGLTLAELALAVLDRCLRDHAEHVPPPRREAKQQR